MSTLGSKWKCNWTNNHSTKKQYTFSFTHFQEHASPLFKKLNLLKLTDIVRQNNIVFTHDTINAKTPPIFESYFIFDKTSHQHETVNSLNSIYSLPTGSLKLPAYRTESGKSSIRFICPSTCNAILKDISMKNIIKYNKDLFWVNKSNIKTLRHIFHKHFLEYYWTQKYFYLMSMEKTFSFLFFSLNRKGNEKLSITYELSLSTTFR